MNNTLRLLRHIHFGALLTVLMLCIGRVKAQPRNGQFMHLSVKDGLSHNSVNCILQDQEGFIWFGTDDGLNKFDGYTFTVFQPDPTKPNRSLLGARVLGLHEDQAGRLWAVTYGGGLHEIDKRSGTVTPHPIRAKLEDWWNSQTSIFEDSQGVLWISTYAGLARYNPESHQFVLYPSPQLEVPVATVAEDRQHRLWVGTSQGLYQFDRQTGKYSLLPTATNTGKQPYVNAIYADDQDKLWLGTMGQGLFQLDVRTQPLRVAPYNPNGQVNKFLYLNSIREDKDGLLWMGSNDGLQQIDQRMGLVNTYRPDPTKLGSISGNNAQAVFIDRTGGLWIGTNNGLDYLPAETKSFAYYQVTPNDGRTNLIDNRVNSLLQDHNGTTWFTNMEKVYHLDSKRKRLQIVPPSQFGSTSQHTNYICSLMPDGNDGIWFSTWDGLYRYDYASGQFVGYPAEIHTQFISRGPTGILWTGGEGGIASFDPRNKQYTYYKYSLIDTTGLPDKYVYALLASRTGDVWVAVHGKGLSCLHPPTGRFKRYTAGTKPGELNDKEIISLHEDRAGYIWIGTKQGGLSCFDPKTGLFTHYTTQDGLLSNHISAITSDQNGNLWLSTNRGLCRFNTQTKTARRYDVNDGLPSNQFIEAAVFKRGNTLFFGSMNGFVHFNPATIRDNTRPFPVYITGYKVMDKSQRLPDSAVTLEYDENFLSFEFAALTYTQPERNQYAFKLTNVDKDWVRSGSRRFASYTDLPPGTYVFRVKAANSDGVWNEKGASLRITILPPWWATWWAYACYVLLAGGAIYGLIRFYAQRIYERQRMELQRQETEQLKAVDELKTRFFSNITHEFRTPLSLIISPVQQLLRDQTASEAVRQRLSMVERNSQQLLRLINQLLDLSKLEAGQMEIVNARGRIDEFIEPIMHSFGLVAEQKGVTLKVDNQCAVDQEFHFDAEKWEKIIYNLLSNAIKFTPSGGAIDITIKQPNPNQVAIRIADTGIGISADKLPRIFDRFYQVDDSRTRAYQGTGIGLSLVKELVDLLGGSIKVRSEVGASEHGTTFDVRLPVKPVDGTVGEPFRPAISSQQQVEYLVETFSPIEQPSETVNEAAPLILVVEDNDDLREFIAGGLALQYRVRTASDGQEGWNIAQQELPDLIITDVMMPGMDGYQLTHQVKTSPLTDHIAVVMLTARASHDSRIEGLQQGADDYLTKPFHVDELHLRLRNLIERKRKLQEHYQQQLTTFEAPFKPEEVEDPFLKQLYQYIESRLDDPNFTVEDLAVMNSMSRRTLHRKLTALTNLSANDLIRTYRLKKAAELLRAGYSVSDTAYRVGFDNPSYFTTVFKQTYQQTPTEFAAH